MSTTAKATYRTCRQLGLSAVSSIRLARMGEARHSRVNAVARIDSALSNVILGTPIADAGDESYTLGRFYR